MASARYSLSTYQRANNTLPIVVGIVTALVVALLIAYSIVGAVLKYRKSRTLVTGREFIFASAKFMLGGAVEKNDDKYSLFGKGVCLTSLYIFAILAPVVLCATFLTFWGAFLIEESFRCDSELDCFPINSSSSKSNSTGGSRQQYAVEDCTPFDTQDNVTFECYEFVLRYAAGFGEAGGVIVLAPGIIEVYVGLLIYITNFGERGGKVRRYSAQICTLFLAGVPLALVIGILHVSINVQAINEIFFRTTESTLQFVAYYTTLFSTFFLAVQVLAITRSVRKRGDSKAEDSVPKLSGWYVQNDEVSRDQELHIPYTNSEQLNKDF